MIADHTSQSRPHFYSADEWLQHYEECQASGHRGWHPATREELMLAESCGLLALHPEWLPSKIGLRILDLPDWFGRQQKPRSAQWQERFVQTLIDNPNTLEALRAILIGGPTDGCN